MFVWVELLISLDLINILITELTHNEAAKHLRRALIPAETYLPLTVRDFLCLSTDIKHTTRLLASPFAPLIFFSYLRLLPSGSRKSRQSVAVTGNQTGYDRLIGALASLSEEKEML